MADVSIGDSRPQVLRSPRARGLRLTCCRRIGCPRPDRQLSSVNPIAVNREASAIRG
jgi:hypothetical protein